MKKVLLMMCLMGLVACDTSFNVDGTKPDQKPMSEYRNEAAAGVIGGAPWLFLSGRVRPSYSDSSQLDVSLHNEDFTDPCSGFSYSKANVLTSIPAALGETLFGAGNPMQTATFNFTDANGASMNMIVTEGRLLITSISETEVTGSIIGYYDNQNYVNGSFKLKVCSR